MRNEILCGDARELARTLPDESVHCVVTSPPYFGLRDYGCDGQMGLEDTPDAYVAGMVDLFRELRRALHPTGTLWLNLGSSYAGSGGAGGDYNDGGLKAGQPRYNGTGNVQGFKAKDLIPIPWMVAMALQQDGWYLRSDIIWHKPNPMPSSAQDRPTGSHEYLFLFSKSPQYFYDALAIAEPAAFAGKITNDFSQSAIGMNVKPSGNAIPGISYTVKSTRNRRSVWTIPTKSYPAAHFATFPPDLIRPCILAGTSAYGVCGTCGSPYVRVVERERQATRPGNPIKADASRNDNGRADRVIVVRAETTGWQPSCTCDADVVPAIVLDPFLGSGTTAAVAIETGRDWLGFELNPEYVELAMDRIFGSQPALFSQGIA